MFAYRPEVEASARKHGLDPDLVEAVCWIESSGHTHAYRYEPAFYERYLQGKPEWEGVPERISASYGLMQVMFPTAVEYGYPIDHPPEYLFVPTIGLEYGCRVLAHRMTWSARDLPAALAAYNGGLRGNAPGGPLRNAAYANKVLDRLAAIKGTRRA